MTLKNKNNRNNIKSCKIQCVFFCYYSGTPASIPNCHNTHTHTHKNSQLCLFMCNLHSSLPANSTCVWCVCLCLQVLSALSQLWIERINRSTVLRWDSDKQHFLFPSDRCRNRNTNPALLWIADVPINPEYTAVLAALLTRVTSTKRDVSVEAALFLML